MKTRIFWSLLFLGALLAAGSASADPWHTSNTLLGHAVPDECYAGIGVDYPGGVTPGDGFTTPVNCPDTIPDPGAPGFELEVVPKTNDSYVWALTEEGDSLWFASAANVMCTTAGVFLGELSYGQSDIRVDRFKGFTATGKVIWDDYLRDDAIGSPVCGYIDENNNEVTRNCSQEQISIRVPYNVCEHGDSQVVRNGTWPTGTTGDWRPSKVFRYIKSTGALINLTQQIYAAGDGAIFDSLLGIRAAGSHNDVVFFAGGDQNLNVTMFAFQASTGDYLGSNTFDGWRQIRKMTVSQNFLYVGVSRQVFGQVFVWLGDVNNPFAWTAVGTVLGAITEIAQYIDNGGGIHILANSGQGLFLSPAMTTVGGQTRLIAYNATYGQWVSVWSYSSYDPDPLNITGPGGLGQLGEFAYWGTMHVPYIGAYMNANAIYGGLENIPPEVQNAMFSATFRTTSIWRGRNLGLPNQQIELLYGEKYLGTYDGANWVMVPTGWQPTNMPPPGTVHPYFGTEMGSSGFFNPNNNYSWVVLPFSDATGDHLFFGTMDQTLIGSNDIRDLKGTNYQFPANDGRGADMWRFSLNGFGGATATTAAAEFKNGAGNIFQYGVRCMIASDDGQKIYLGMANNGSLMHPYSDLPGDEPRDHFNGGWELRELSRP